MSIPLNSAGTGKVYLGDKIICNNSCYNTDILILEGRLGRDSTSSRHGGIYFYNTDYSSIGWIGHTSFRGANIEFNRATDSVLTGNSFTGFKEFRLKLDRINQMLYGEMRDTLDSGSAIYSSSHATTSYTQGNPVLVGIQSNDRYYHNGQFDWFRVKDGNGNTINYIDFNDNQLPSGYTLYGGYPRSETNTGYSISNGVLTLSIDPYDRCLVFNTIL